jgi:hypothetical protein
MHRLHIIRSPPPVTPDGEIAQLDLCGPASLDRPHAFDVFWVTKRFGRNGDSWLARMPVQAYMP